MVAELYPFSLIFGVGRRTFPLKVYAWQRVARRQGSRRHDLVAVCLQLGVWARLVRTKVAGLHASSTAGSQ